MQDLTFQVVHNSVLGIGLAYYFMGPRIKAFTNASWNLRGPVAMTLMLFFHQQTQYWDRGNKVFHEIMAQPAPHGSYLRRTVKEHFPVWWHDVSATLAHNGYNLPEMNEYDRAKWMQKSHT